MSPYTQSNDDPLSYTKAPSLSFKDVPVGHVYKGTITKKPTLVQSRNFETGEPATWPDGNPKMSVVIQLDLNGEARSLWAPKPSAMFAALVEAQKVAGGQPMQEGGTLYIKFTGTTPNAKNPRLNEAKQYACKYEPPIHEDPFGAAQPPHGQQAPPPQQGGWNSPPQQQPRPVPPANKPAW